MSTVGQVLFSFFEDHLKVQKGLRPDSIKSYRDTMKLFLNYIAQAYHKPITRLSLADLLTQGRATYTMEFRHYAQTPPSVAAAIVHAK